MIKYYWRVTLLVLTFNKSSSIYYESVIDKNDQDENLINYLYTKNFKIYLLAILYINIY